MRCRPTLSLRLQTQAGSSAVQAASECKVTLVCCVIDFSISCEKQLSTICEYVRHLLHGQCGVGLSSDYYNNSSPVSANYKGLMKQHTRRALIQLFCQAARLGKVAGVRALWHVRRRNWIICADG